MSSEIPEIFKALLEYPFSLPSIDDIGKNFSIGSLHVNRDTLINLYSHFMYKVA